MEENNMRPVRILEFRAPNGIVVENFNYEGLYYIHWVEAYEEHSDFKINKIDNGYGQFSRTSCYVTPDAALGETLPFKTEITEFFRTAAGMFAKGTNTLGETTFNVMRLRHRLVDANQIPITELPSKWWVRYEGDPRFVRVARYLEKKYNRELNDWADRHDSPMNWIGYGENNGQFMFVPPDTNVPGQITLDVFMQVVKPSGVEAGL